MIFLNMGIHSICVIFDTTPPNVTITSPPPYSLVSPYELFDISGIVTPPNDNDLWLVQDNGIFIQATVDSFGIFIFKDVYQTEASFTYEVTDFLNNVGDSVTLYLDTDDDDIYSGGCERSAIQGNQSVGEEDGRERCESAGSVFIERSVAGGEDEG